MTSDGLQESMNPKNCRFQDQEKDSIQKYDKRENILFKQNPEAQSPSSPATENNHQNQTLQKQSQNSPAKRTVDFIPNNHMASLPELQTRDRNKIVNEKSFNKSPIYYNQKLKVNTQRLSNQKLYNEGDLNSVKKQQNASEVLAELEEIHRKRSIQRKQANPHKSLQIEARVLKLNPQRASKKKDKKRKQAEEKLKVNLQFLERLKIKPKVQKPTFKQFRNDSQNTFQSSKVLKLRSIHKIQLGSIENGSAIRYSTDRKSPNDIRATERSLNSINILLESPLKLPPLDSKHCLKPKPYSIYNIYQKNNQLYTNAPSKNHWQEIFK